MCLQAFPTQSSSDNGGRGLAADLFTDRDAVESRWSRRKTNVTGVKSALCSAQLTHSCVKFLNRCQMKMVSIEITLCEVALKKRKSFALKSVENAKAVRAT